MRICDAFCGVAVAAALGFAGQALAFDVKNINPDTPPAEAFKYGFDAYKQGDKLTAVEALNFAAEKGHPAAQWKLGRMYAEGDGIKQDDYRAFELFSEIADAHAEDSPNEPSARFVSNAFVRSAATTRRASPTDQGGPDSRPSVLQLRRLLLRRRRGAAQPRPHVL